MASENKMIKEQREVCPRCKGAGWADSYTPMRIDIDDCPYCDGKGFITRGDRK